MDKIFQAHLELASELDDIEEKLGLLANLGDAFAVSGEIDRAKKYYQDRRCNIVNYQLLFVFLLRKHF